MGLCIAFGFQSNAMAGDATAGKAKSQVCAGCHGMNGVSMVPTYPNLAGQKEQYLVKAINDFKRNLLLKTWTKEKVDSFDIKDEDIKAAYDERVTKLASKEFNARHILVKTEDEAKAIIKEVNDGADFATLAKEKSTGPSGSNGGSLGWFKAQTMVPAFANAVKAMSKGDVSKEPVKTQFGYHVIKLEDSRDAKLPTLESLKPQLQRVISQKKMLAYMEDLKKTADIKITLPEEKAEAKEATEEKK